jgi:hypothetical protein
LKNQINDCKPILKKESRICKEGNEFPELLMKEEYQPQENLTATPPVVYRLNKESKIYDAIGGSVFFRWEEKTSFTSVFETKNWVVISGYFVDKVWKRAEQNLWIEKSNITKR